jgi:hypothetical protein
MSRTARARPPGSIPDEPERIKDRPLTISAELQRDRIISLPEAATLTGLSIDTLRRHYPILRLSPRRVGMKLSVALAIGTPV